MISQEETFGSHLVVTTTVKGLNHCRQGIVNQDSVNYCFQNNNFALAVADGVGSCSMADVGSEMATKAVVDVFNFVNNKSIPFESDKICEYLLLRWKEMLGDKQIDDCCTTLKAVMKIDNKIMLFSIGDGLVGVSSEGVCKLSPKEESVFTNITNCLCSGTKIENIWTDEFLLGKDSGYIVLACTDGVVNGLVEDSETQLLKEIEIGVSSGNLKKELEELVEDISDYIIDDKTVGVVKYEKGDK